MEPIEQLASILPTLNAVVDRIDPSQLDKSTPCDRFTVRDVLNHMIVLGGSFAYSFRGEEVPEIKAPPVDGRVPATEFRATMDDLFDAVRSAGATERIISTPMGEMPGSVFARFVAFDGLIHGWDLATATGLTYEPSAGAIAAVSEFAQGALSAAMRDGDTFKEATDPLVGANPLERLVAFSGRSL